MELSVGDLQMLYYLAFIGSTTKDNNGKTDADSKAAEMVEDMVRGEA